MFSFENRVWCHCEVRCPKVDAASSPADEEKIAAGKMILPVENAVPTEEIIDKAVNEGLRMN